jgi:hypothetical protein
MNEQAWSMSVRDLYKERRNGWFKLVDGNNSRKIVASHRLVSQKTDDNYQPAERISAQTIVPIWPVYFFYQLMYALTTSSTSPLAKIPF